MSSAIVDRQLADLSKFKALAAEIAEDGAGFVEAVMTIEPAAIETLHARGLNLRDD